MAQVESQVVTTVRNHWWWRPGWRTGRHFYACHLTLDDQPQLRALVRQYQDALAQLPGLDLILARWLHVTMQGIGFTDEISTADLAAVTAGLGERLRAMEAPVATFHRPTIQPEAVLEGRTVRVAVPVAAGHVRGRRVGARSGQVQRTPARARPVQTTRQRRIRQ